MKKEYSKECIKLAELCWSDNEIRSTSVIIGETYNDKDNEKVKYKIKEEVYEELLSYQSEVVKKFRVNRHGKVINLIGIK